MEAICCSETTVDFQRNTRRYIPEDGTRHNHRCENLKSYTLHGYHNPDDHTTIFCDLIYFVQNVTEGTSYIV
jgi:hypothetical protein